MAKLFITFRIRFVGGWLYNRCWWVIQMNRSLDVESIFSESCLLAGDGIVSN